MLLRKHDTVAFAVRSAPSPRVAREIWLTQQSPAALAPDALKRHANDPAPAVADAVKALGWTSRSGLAGTTDNGVALAVLGAGRAI